MVIAQPESRVLSGPHPAAPNSREPWLRRLTVNAMFWGLLATIVSAIGSGIPSYWGDEAASVMSAERSLPSLFSMLGTVDAVHGTYYLVLHFWIELFGASPFAVRLLSAIAVGVATAGTVVLARWLSSRSTAVLTGLLCVVLPRFTYMGSEARSAALNTAVVVWLTVYLMWLLRKGERRWGFWWLYGLGVAASLYTFLFGGLILVAHAALVATRPRSRALASRWLGGVGVGLAVSAPLLVFSILERHQVAFLAHRTRVTVEYIVAEQWFGSTWLAILCWALIVIGLAVAGRAWWRDRRVPEGLPLLVIWLIAPTVLLLVGNAVVAPMYTNRYLSFCAPAAAILVAAGITALRGRGLRIVSVVAILALAAPIYLAQRSEFGKPGGSDWALASAILHANSHPGDGVLFDQNVKPSWRPRLALHLYPDDYRGLVDVALKVPYGSTTGLWDTVVSTPTLEARLAPFSTVWAIEATKSQENSPHSDVSVLRAAGFTLVQSIAVHRTIIDEFTKGSS